MTTPSPTAVARPPLLDLSPLARPAWWLALAVLLVNDNLLKTSATAPRWLTGKLSDFAFLVVAPVLLFALLPRRLPARRALALALVAGIYAAADLSPAFSRWFVVQARALGFTWQLWPDLTDLLALAVLPFTARLMTPAPASSRPLRPAAVAVGAFACLATSAPPDYAHRPFLINRSDRTTELTVAFSAGPQPCSGDFGELLLRLPATSFLPPVTVTLASGEVAALDAPPADGQAPTGHCTNTTDPPSSRYSSSTTEPAVCTVVVIRQPGRPPTAMRAERIWYTSNDAFFICAGDNVTASRCAPRLDPILDPGDGAVAVVKDGNGLTLMAHKGIELARFPGP